MEIQLTKTIEPYLVHLIRDELQFVCTPYNQIKSLAEEIYSNIVTGLLLIEKEVYRVFKLLHRVISKQDSFEIETVSPSQLLMWVQKDEIRDYLLRFIADNLLVFSEMQSIARDYEDSDCYIIQDSGQEKKSRELQNGQKMVQEQQQKVIICKDQELSVNSSQFESVSNKYQAQKCCKNQEYESYQNQDCEQVYDNISELLQKRQQNQPKEFHYNEFSHNEFSHNEEQPQFIGPQANENQNQNALQLHQNDPATLFNPESPPISGTHLERRYSFDSINNDASYSSQQQIKTLKLTDARRPNQDEQVLSEVSSFNNEQSFASASIYMVEDTSRYGHPLYGDKIDKILRSYVSKSSIFLLVRWKTRSNGYQPLESFLQSMTLREHSPQQLIQFYKSMDS